jgi:hypothetical protein
MSHRQGIQSKNIRERNHAPKTSVKGIRPAGVNQLGAKAGNKITEKGKSDFRGEPLREGKSFQPCPFGNELTMGTNGPGKGVVNYGKSGSQGLQGTPSYGSPAQPGIFEPLSLSRKAIDDLYGPQRWETENTDWGDVDE